MDKKKIKTIQMQYPAPYSQSWPTQLIKKPKKVASALLANNSKAPRHMPNASSDWLKRQAVCRGSDPTAPHLKYGVFHNRRPVVRIQPRYNNNVKPLKYEQNTKTMISEHSINKKKIKKTIKKGTPDQPSEFCPVDKHNSKQLTKSEVKHMDIKPRQRALSPGMRAIYNVRRSPPLSPVSRFIKRGD